MSTKNVTLKEKVNGAAGNVLFPATTTPNVYDSAKSQALSQTLVNTPDYEALGFAKFSTATAYNTGDKVYKDNGLYRFIADKTAGEWDVAKVEPWSIEQEIEEVNDAIRSLIPAQASADNKLADKAYVNDKVATDTATFRGTFNLVTDLELTTDATQGQIATALGTAISGEDKNDYAFVQIPTSDATPTEIARIDRYKYTGLQWAFEYSLNNSGFTAEQWAAINSGITSSLVTAFGAKYDKPAGGIPASDMDTSTFDDEPIAGSDNLVKSGGVADALGSYQILTSASSVHNGYDISGNPQGTLDTYFYPVSEGDTLKINYNLFSSGFSVVQAWNDNTFVASVLNSPLTEEGSIFYKVPAGVNKVGCTYFQNNVYLYVPTLTFDSKPTQYSQKLLKSGAIYKSCVFCGSLDGTSEPGLNSFDLQQGLWYVNQNTPNMPFASAGFVQNQGISGVKQQIAIDLLSAEIYIRVSTNSSWGNWRKANYSYYRRSLTPSDNINTLYNEGVYFLTLSQGGNNTPQGTLPITGNYSGLLVVNGAGSVSQQTIFVFGSNDIYVRSGISSYSNWEKIVKKGDLSGLATTEQLNSAIQTLINNYLEETELKSANSSIAGLFKPDGTPAASAVNTYFYNVNEGDVLRIIYGTFSDGFSVVQAWNGDTFVESLLNSPTTGSGNILNYTVPQGVTKIGCSYFNNNVYLVEKVTDDLYEKINDTNERVDELSKGTRNLWTFANTDISYTSYIILGTTGVKLLDAGTYTLSFELTVENSSLGAELVAYLIGAKPVQILHQQKSTNGRIAITFTVSSDIERLFFSFYSAQTGNVASFTNIQLEVLDWKGYTSSPEKGEWATLPYATPFIKPSSLNDIVSREVISYWNGKTINYNGDSVTQGIGANRIGWVRVVNQILKFGKVNNYAIGGTRLAHPLREIPVDPNETVNCMVDRYQDMSLDCDIVMIMANTNDYSSQVPIGNSDSTSPNEYNGALNIIFSWLKANFKTQPIIISTMLTRKVNYDGGGQPLPITIEQYAEAVRERTAAYGFILYDAYKLSGLDLLNSVRDGSGITDDGLHPNSAGALSLGRKIAAFINAQ